MTPFVIPNVNEFGAMTDDNRIKALLPIANYQAYRIAKHGSRHVDDYKSAGAVGLLDFCRSFKRESFQDQGHFRSVCLRVARNSIIDERRRLVGRFSRGKWRGLETVDIKSVITPGCVTLESLPTKSEDRIPDEADSPAEALERAEMPDRAENLISLLGDRAQKVVRMIYYEGKTQIEVGKIMGVTNSRISQILQAALRKLRSQ
jgi:RNA polymerase sigma factor (sigma-70 family)